MMKQYKQQLHSALTSQGWELVAQLPAAASWADEHWRIESRREHWGLTLVLSFILSPMDEGDQQPVPVWDIRATTDLPDSRLEDASVIASLDMCKGRFDEKLAVFLAELDRYRQQA